MWKKLLSGTEWAEMLDFVSPSLFDVLPSGELLKQVKELAGNSRDRAGCEAGKSALAARLQDLQWPIGLNEAPVRPEPDSEAITSRGQLVLRLYFLQLWSSDLALLDLRHSRFEERLEGLAWMPRPLFVRWQPEFIDALRAMYEGFYEGKEEQFKHALRELNLDAAEDVFRGHFGTGDQTDVAFSLAGFRRDFHDVFVRCKEQRRSLHRNFVPLGVYLACLFEHLEGLGRTQDVRQAYFSARRAL